MATPLEIVFHNTPATPDIEEEIRKQVGYLERRFGQLLGCRVSVERQHRQRAGVYDVRVEPLVPGRPLAVGDSRRPCANDARPELLQALRGAFRGAERRLLGNRRRVAGEPG